MNILISLSIAATATAAGLADGTKGTLNLSVAVQDELGIDTVSEVVELRHVKASEIEGFIRTRLSKWGTVQTNDALNMVILTDKKEKLRDLTALLHKLDSDQLKDFLRLETLSIRLNYTDPASIQATVRSQMSPEGSLVIDSAHNALLITDLKSKVASVKALVERLDTFVPQVVLELAVVEASDDLLRNAGLDWGVLNKLGSVNGSIRGGEGTDRQHYVDSPGPTSDTLREYSNSSRTWDINASFDVSSFLNVITNENKGKVLIRTRLSGANGGRASFNSGWGSSNWSSTPETGRNDGLTFSVLPRVGEGELATLDIQASVINFLGWDNSNHPILDSRSLNSSAVMKDGETLLLGGLKKVQMVDADKGVPGLRYILPFLFSRVTKSQVESDLLMFVTLHIKRDFAQKPDLETEKALDALKKAGAAAP